MESGAQAAKGEDVTRQEHDRYTHKRDDIGYGLGGCQALVNGYPDVKCSGCRVLLKVRRAAREKGKVA